MRGLIQKMDEIFLKINKFIIGSMMGSMFIMVLANVVTRYLFGNSLVWIEEVSRILMIAICFIGAGLALREGRHVAIEFVIDLIKNEKLNKTIRAINGVIILAFMGFLAYLGFMYSLETMGQESTVLRWDMGLVYLLIPIGAITFMMHLILMFKDFISPESMEEEETPNIQKHRSEGLI